MEYNCLLSVDLPRATDTARVQFGQRLEALGWVDEVGRDSTWSFEALEADSLADAKKQFREHIEFAAEKARVKAFRATLAVTKAQLIRFDI